VRHNTKPRVQALVRVSALLQFKAEALVQLLALV
jgi:hypothetical protein